MQITITTRELATILHALRVLQNDGCMERMCQHFEDEPALTNPEINELCEKINFGNPECEKSAPGPLSSS